MKKSFILPFISFVYASILFAATSTSSVTTGATPVQQEAAEDSSPEFGGTYVLFKGEHSTEYTTILGKIYYRLNSTDNSDDSAQKIDIKRAAVKIRPTGTPVFEAAIGKRYSYYLPGGYFPLSEIYTGANRWGETGAGIKFSAKGLSAGLALPVTESYGKFKEGWGLNGALSYDFKEITSFPLTLGTTLLFSSAGDGEPDDFSDDDLSGAFSALYSYKNNDSILKAASLFASYSFNSSPYVASGVYKNISNYKNVSKADFCSAQINLKLSKMTFNFEGEFGKSKENDYLPLYAGTQILFPLNDFISLRPQFFYYAALNSKDSDLSRSAYTLYPRLMFYKGNHTVSAGAQFTNFQNLQDEWHWGWSVPLYWEYKFSTK